jgi:HSP20 family molecular chaperone IbpA
MIPRKYEQTIKGKQPTYKNGTELRENRQNTILRQPLRSSILLSKQNSTSNSQATMAFFSQSSFSPLFQLLNDYEAQPEHKLYNDCQPLQYPKPVQCPKSRPRSSFAPAFDVRELDEGYYLDGELPGVDQSNVEIEFTDPHTLVIKGHTDRNYNNDATPSRSPSPAGWHQATVEDEQDDAESISTASTVDTAASKQEEKAQPHFWAKERSIGDFQRTFSFTARVDQDSVRASLKNGVLSVFVPKEAVPLPKKIRIQ